MVNGRWKRGLQKITTTSEINQNVRLWSMLRDYQLTDHADEMESTPLVLLTACSSWGLMLSSIGIRCGS
jgi:hypothetical protein